jgi:glycogen(starch) synthase
MKQRGLAFHLARFGLADGGEYTLLSSMAAELGLGADTLSLHEATTQPESILSAADAAVVPSQWPEPFGLAAIEAMACGTVPIVSDAGILPEIIGPENARCVFPQGDFAKLADRITFVLTDADSRRLIRASCIERVQTHFDLSRCGKAYEAIFERVMREP